MAKTQTGIATVTPRPAVSVIVPARNEEACLAECLESLVAQRGLDFEIIVVDDHSTDRTPHIARSLPGVQLVEAGALPNGWTGKNNAAFTGAQAARGEWLLFTDADTVHLPGSLARSLHEAKRHQAALLSYSPQQIVKSFWEKALMPVIFAELAASYRPSEVNDPASPSAAANGQYILISREAYDAVGGHAAVAGSLLEDVALARAVKRSGRKLWFRYGGDIVRTRMYRNWKQLREGWTKNLALLFPSARLLAIWRAIEFVVLVTCLAACANALRLRDYTHAILYAAVPLVTFTRIRRAHFSWDATLLAMFGLPLFSYLLLRSRRAHAHGDISWKGRMYSGSAASKASSDTKHARRPSTTPAPLLESRR